MARKDSAEGHYYPGKAQPDAAYSAQVAPLVTFNPDQGNSTKPPRSSHPSRDRSLPSNSVTSNSNVHLLQNPLDGGTRVPPPSAASLRGLSQCSTPNSLQVREEEKDNTSEKICLARERSDKNRSVQTKESQCLKYLIMFLPYILASQNPRLWLHSPV